MRNKNRGLPSSFDVGKGTVDVACRLVVLSPSLFCFWWPELRLPTTITEPGDVLATGGEEGGGWFWVFMQKEREREKRIGFFSFFSFFFLLFFFDLGFRAELDGLSCHGEEREEGSLELWRRRRRRRSKS